MNLQTCVTVSPLAHQIVYADRILFLGSCFADEVGALCRGLGFNAMVNPFGVLFNAASITQSVARLREGRPFASDEVVAVNSEFYCTFSHNTSFWKPSAAELLECANNGFEKAVSHFSASKWVVVSLGTSWVYRHIESGAVVSNCHKMPSRLFAREFMSVEHSADCLSAMLRDNPDKHFIFTVSPLRHLKDGLHNNQLSKSALLLAVERVCTEHSNADYFPAYEIVMDELRDYRFYKEDMIHPTDQTVRHVWERFAECAVAPSERPAMEAAAEFRDMLRHKPLFPQSEAFRKFEAQKQHKAEELRRRFPSVCIENIGG